MAETIKTFKGFDSELKCRGFQYEVGKTYTMPEGEKIKMCGNGFHAIAPDETPLRVFDYYPPCDGNRNPARYCEVEVGGETDSKDEKIVGSELTVGAEIGIPGLVKAHIEWVKRHLIDDDEHKSHNTGDCSSASNTGDCSSASNTGDCSSASVGGKESVAIVTGRNSKAKGAIGCWLVLTERDEDYHILGMQCVKVDGETIKADTWYKLVDGKVQELED